MFIVFWDAALPGVVIEDTSPILDAPPEITHTDRVPWYTTGFE